MLPKEGDDLGIKPLLPRIAKEEEIIRAVFALHGVGKVLLRNHVPVNQAKKYFDDYEITPEYGFKWEAKERKVKVIEKPWSIKDDNGVVSFSLLAPPVVVGMIKQLVEVLGL